MQRIHVLLLRFLAVAAALILTTPASATSCSRDCGGTCSGGCTIDSIDCSVSCVGGSCPGGEVTCSEYGGTTLNCNHSFTHKCETGGEGLPGGPETQGLRVLPQSEWAVLKFRSDEVHPVSAAQVQLIAASSPRYGGLAVDQLVRSTHEAWELGSEVRKEARSRGDTAIAFPPESLPVGEQVRFFVDTAEGCARVELELPREAPADVRGSAFLRVIVGTNGEISAVSPLYAEPKTDLKALSGFLRKRGRILTTSETPLEAFVYLRASDAGVSHIVGGGARLF